MKAKRGRQRPALRLLLGGLLWGAAAAPAAPAASPAIAMAQAARLQSESQVQAAYLINFLRYTEWPARSFDSPHAPYVIAVVGDAAVADSVRAVAGAAARIKGRAIEVRWIEGARGSRAAPFDSAQDRENLLQLRRSHLVFFHNSAGAIPSKALSDLWGQPVLTVSDVPDFTRAGGMLGLVRVSGHVVFQANPVAIRSAHLMLSAKVLKLARLTAGTLQ